MPTSEDAPKVDVDHRPTVYGYLRDEEPDEIQIGLWRKQIGLFCEEQGYRLALVFVDRGVRHEQVARTGFTGLLDVLELDSSHGVVVPDLGHISDDNHALAQMQRLIRRTASKLIVIRDQPDDFKADGV
jgi:hypothetical protein